MSLREQLLTIRERHGYLDPALVVEEARPKSSPLHDRFEWNDKIAGEAYRRDQAHRLIQSVRVQYTATPDQPKDVRAFIAVPRGENRQPEYVPTETALADQFTRHVVLQQMEREWQALKARYGDLVEFAAMIDASMHPQAS